MRGKRLFILGAGASIAHTKGLFPSITDFFTKANELEIFSKEKHEFKELANYIQEFFGQNIFKKRIKINIETIFTHLEIQLERSSGGNLIGIREQLLNLIRLVLIELASKVQDEDGEYKKFAKQLRETDTIITFNWDLLLDDILNRKDMLKNKNFSKEYRPQQYRNFLRDLSAFSESTTWRNIFAKPPYEKWESEEGLYLKLHGSVDWVYCPNEYCRGFGKVFPVLEPTKKYYCSNCHEEMVTLLIPPVLNKQYRKYPLIRRLWNTAAQEMHSVAELIIWGYSLPATDFYNEWLLREARKSKNIKKLILINPNNIRKGKQGNYISRTFVIRFYNLFRDIIPKELIELYEYFEDYLAKNDLFSKYNLDKKEEALKRL